MGQRLSSVQQFDSSIGTTDKFEQGSQDRQGRSSQRGKTSR